ncbi:MAG: DUF2809 domain-containing protein [Algicola sp.]|nr:DUF2809 domain-containing protein [Algicola sp.]
MSLKFHKTFFVASLLLFLVEVAIAIWLKDGFIRHTFGDYLVVILMYCATRSMIETTPIVVAIVVLGIAFAIEFLQLVNLLDYLHLRDRQLAVLLLGSTFEISDLIAYFLGVITIFLIDTKIKIIWTP